VSGKVTFLKEFRSALDEQAERAALESSITTDEAYRSGFEDGIAAANTDKSAKMLTAIQTLNNALNDKEALQEKLQANIARDSGEAVAAVIRKLCPHLTNLGLGNAAKDLMETTLRAVPRPIVIGAAPESVEQVSAVLCEHLDCETTIEAREGLTQSQLDVTWPEGLASINYDSIAARIIELAASIDDGPTFIQRGER